MLYYLALFLENTLNPPGVGVFKYITFRSAGAAITALLISLIFGQTIIRFLQKKQIGEQSKAELKEVGNHHSKAGTPTMGGIIVLISVLLPTLFWANILN